MPWTTRKLHSYVRRHGIHKTQRCLEIKYTPRLVLRAPKSPLHQFLTLCKQSAYSMVTRSLKSYCTLKLLAIKRKVALPIQRGGLRRLSVRIPITKPKKQCFYCLSTVRVLLIYAGIVSNVFTPDRLVESSAIKRAIEGVYSGVLPKGACPFVYLRCSGCTMPPFPPDLI